MTITHADKIAAVRLCQQEAERYITAWQDEPQSAAYLGAYKHEEVLRAILEDLEAQQNGPTDEELQALIKPIWLRMKPSRQAQEIRSSLSVEFDDGKYKQWISDFIPDYVWDLVDIAAERGLTLPPPPEEQR